jgi:hypothetical protein
MSDSLVERTKSFLAAHIGIDVVDVRVATQDVDHLELRQETAVIGFGGGLLIAFSFPQEMIDVLYRRLTESIVVPPGEEALYRRAAVSEVANVIIGHCTADFAADGKHVSISPPVVLEDAKNLYRTPNATFGTILIGTSHGSFDIYLIGSRNMNEFYLEYGLETDNVAAQCTGGR